MNTKKQSISLAGERTQMIADNFFAQAQDAINDYRNLQVEDYRVKQAKIQSAVDQIVQSRYTHENHFIALVINIIKDIA